MFFRDLKAPDGVNPFGKCRQKFKIPSSTKKGQTLTTPTFSSQSQHFFHRIWGLTRGKIISANVPSNFRLVASQRYQHFSRTQLSNDWTVKFPIWAQTTPILLHVTWCLTINSILNFLHFWCVSKSFSKRSMFWNVNPETMDVWSVIFWLFFRYGVFGENFSKQRYFQQKLLIETSNPRVFP